MRRLIAILMFMLFFTSIVWAQDVKVIYPKRFDKSPPLRDMIRPATEIPPELRPDTEVPNRIDRAVEEAGGTITDPGLQTAEGTRPAGPTTLNFEGANNFDNQSVVGFRVAPPDPNMDVGPDHIFQSINLVSEIFDKSGNSLLGPFATSDIWAGFGGACEMNNDGDPVTLYDPLADRWLVSQFVFSQSQCVAISQTADPTGAYFRYEFSTPGNDYPKMGVMNDAYYITIRNFSGAFNIDAGAMNRAKMLTGDPSAEFIVRDLTAASGLNLEGWLPSDIDGFSAPASGGVFIGQEFQATNNRLVQFDMVPNFANPPATVLNGPNFISVNPYDISVNSVPQPAPGGNLDVLAFFMMHRLAMRDMGSHLALVANNTVDVGNNRAGVRWYEFRSTSGVSGPWTVHQQGTYAPNDGRHRWMGSIAMNANGDIGLMYTVTNSSTFPSIRYTGRLAGDPLGQMTFAEGIAVTGTGSQTGTSRWGDYSSLSVDPSDDLTFCGTHEYVQTTGSFNWWTRIASFQANNNNPNLVVTLTPVNPPIIVNPPGSFDYTLRVENIGDPTAATVNAQVWTVAQRIGFGETDPLFVTNVSLAPGDVFEQTRTQNVPAIDPDNFNYIAKAGNLPGNVFAQDSFPFSVSGPTTAKAGAEREIPSEWLPVVSASVPEAISLNANYPNPFNPTTQISYDINTATHVKLNIYNVRGQEIKTLVDGLQSPGSKTVTWDGTNNAGQKVAGGVYLYRLQAGDVVQTKKMTLLK